MKIVITNILILISLTVFSQRTVTGIVYIKENNETEPLIGATIKEIGTENFTMSDEDGKYTINTLNDTCTLSYFFIGLLDKNYRIQSDTILNVILPIWDYRMKWFTIGINYDVVNSYYGFQISNGLDEEHYMYFEEFSSTFMYKLSGQINFANDYSIGAKLSWKYPIRHIYRTSIEYSQKNSTSIGYDFYDISHSVDFRLPRLYLPMIMKIGFQKLNDQTNFGFNLGLEKSIKNFYTGFLIGYYFDYFNYSIYFSHKPFYKSLLRLRIEYNRINNFDFFNIGAYMSLYKGYFVE